MPVKAGTWGTRKAGPHKALSGTTQHRLAILGRPPFSSKLTCITHITPYLFHPQLALPPSLSLLVHGLAQDLIGRREVSRQEVLTTLSPTCLHHHPLPLSSLLLKQESPLPQTPSPHRRPVPHPSQLTEHSHSPLWPCPLPLTSPEYSPSALRHVIASSRLKIIIKQNKTQP